MADRSRAAILRYGGMTIEVFNYYIGPLWIEKGNYGIVELLIKKQDQGKRVNLFVLSGTELVEGGPVSRSTGPAVPVLKQRAVL